ncbi:hypothetical protein [Piscinibacter gummiphilus]|uniref:Uncharacterized protein n=1 Tax=Piscinibacter gummiphilus TaxID=946333 RepID=A0A1W6L5J4_9BURK|nr:hypothetical protein [Piscinibacter gummiphilus]ARN19408.1 hypothetical protein A4W93_05480 [Piscinibacter gummiphilus]ATU64075.1 hypothetical protein CPZ87_05565 [Piscinibacter gummiphilus]GLS92960.1 hypothetical protein GCM10007918_02510 [Piscinibacter gummiphilus]
MNASKTLTALAAAAALVGTIGYASAQQSGSDTMPPNAGSPADTAQPAVTTPAPMDSNATLPSDAAATMDSERAPQADRN